MSMEKEEAKTTKVTKASDGTAGKEVPKKKKYIQVFRPQNASSKETKSMAKTVNKKPVKPEEPEKKMVKVRKADGTIVLVDSSTIKRKPKPVKPTEPAKAEAAAVINDAAKEGTDVKAAETSAAAAGTASKTAKKAAEAAAEAPEAAEKAAEAAAKAPEAAEKASEAAAKASYTTRTSIPTSKNNIIIQGVDYFLGNNIPTTTDKTSDIVAKDSSLTKNDVMNLLSCEERQLIEDNNLDLTEKLDDGSPRYIIAKGKQDDKYHVYDMKNNGASIARQYGTTGSGLRGSDICPSGNGYIRNFNKLDEDDQGGEEYFYYDSNNELKSARACYKTCSPLSFDLNGDGVQTSSSTVNFDIDGDGVIDTINDSADAVLVFDKDGDGISGADGSETFGNNTDIDGDGKADGFKDGFEALKALAKQEGLIDGVNDNELDENDLKVLEEKWGLKIKTGGYNSEAQSLSDTGITNIKLSADNSTVMQDNFDGNGNQLMTQEGATFTVNGEEREYADIWHKKLDSTAGGSVEDKTTSGNIFCSLSFDLSVNADLANSSIKISKNAANSAKNSARSAIGNIKNNDTFLEYVNRYNPEEVEEEEKKKKPEK